MQDLAFRVLSVFPSFTSNGVGNMCTFLAQLCDIPYGNKLGTQFGRYDYGGHNRTYGQFYYNDNQTYRRVLKLAHQYRLQLLKIADIIGGSSSGAGQGEPPSRYDSGRGESVHSRQRLANHPVLEMLASNLWIRLGLLTVLCLGAFMYCLIMMEQQQAEIAGRGTNWWADMSPSTSVMSSGSSSAAAATTSIPPSSPRNTEENGSGDAPVGLGVQLPEESVSESTTRDASSRLSTSDLQYFTRRGNVHSSLVTFEMTTGKTSNSKFALFVIVDASSRAEFTWPSLVTLISTIARSTTTVLALTSGTIDMSDSNEMNDGNHSTLHFLESSLDAHPYSLLQRNLTELSGGNTETRFSLRANNNNSHREMVPVTKSRRRSEAWKYGPLVDNRKKETRNKVFNSSIGGIVSFNSSAGSSRTSSRRQSVVSFASSYSISKRRSSDPVDPDNTDRPITTTRQLELADSGYFLAMALIYYSYPYMYTFFRHGIPSSFAVRGRQSTLPSSSSRAMTGLRSRRGVTSLAGRHTRDRQTPLRPIPPHHMRTRPCIQWRQHSMPLQRSCRSQHQRQAQYQLGLRRFVHHQHLSSSTGRNAGQAKLSIRRSRAKFARLSAPTLSSS